jgi:hypothetical protein
MAAPVPEIMDGSLYYYCAVVCSCELIYAHQSFIMESSLYKLFYITAKVRRYVDNFQGDGK